MKSKFKSFQEKLRHYVDGNADSFFEYFIVFVVIVNSVCLGIETSPNISSKTRFILDVIDEACLAIFIVELILKAIAFGKEFFTASEPPGAGWWNTFDLIIVLVSVFAAVPYFSVFRGIKFFRAVRLIKSFRNLRIIKSLKIINSFEQLQRILSAIVHAIPSIIWTFVLLLLVFYFYAIIGVNVFGTEFSEFFGSLGKAFYTLFQLMLFDSWGNITRPILEKSPTAWIYFVSFGIISAYTILQVVTGIVVNSIQNVAQKKSSEEPQTIISQKTGTGTGNERETDERVCSDETNIATDETKSVSLETLSKQIAELQKKIDEMNFRSITK